MFPKRKSPKIKLFGAALFFATVFFSFGHTFSSFAVAFANDQAHKDEVPHAPDSENHSPCPTEMHQTTSNRTTSDEDYSPSLGDFEHCTFAASNSDFVFPENHSISSYLFAREKLPPRLPLQQKTQLLI